MRFTKKIIIATTITTINIPTHIPPINKHSTTAHLDNAVSRETNKAIMNVYLFKILNQVWVKPYHDGHHF